MHRISYLDKAIDDADKLFFVNLIAYLRGSATQDQQSQVEKLINKPLVENNADHENILVRFYWLMLKGKITCDNWQKIEEGLINHPTLQAIYVEFLKRELYFFPLRIQSRQHGEKEQYGYFHQMVSEYMMGAIAQEKAMLEDPQTRTKLHDYACDKLGSYIALYERCQTDLIAVEMGMTSDDVVESAIAENSIKRIADDCKKLIDLYGGLGAVQAGRIYLALAAKFDALKKTPDILNRQILMREQGMIYFLCAYFLRNNEYSNAVIAAATQKQGLASLLDTKEKLDFSSWDKVLADIEAYAGKDSFTRLYEQAEKQVKGNKLKLGS